MVWVMVELKDIALTVADGDSDKTLLERISLSVHEGQFVAIVGASGSGKTTLLKLIAGLYEPTRGHIRWKGRDLVNEEDLAPSEIGYVPQFSIAYDHLTIRESVEMSLRLRVAGLNAAARHARTEALAAHVGLDHILDRRVLVLSGGERRRLALAMELTSDPLLILCDEVTSGLDPKSEEDIVKLLGDLAAQDQRIVVSVTHSLRHLTAYDKVVVLHEGRLAYCGAPDQLVSYFGVKNPEDIYPALAHGGAEHWEQTWAERGPPEEPPPEEHPHRPPLEPAGYMAQTTALLMRRWKIFLRDRAQLALHLAMVLGFPVLVAIFAQDGLPQIQNLKLELGDNLVEELLQARDYIVQSVNVGTLVSGLVMFQVVLLTLMASNNSAREVSSERFIFEKEKLAGLRPVSYVTSKVVFLFGLVALQSVWMACFVKSVCGFPGPLGLQIAMLIMVNAAITYVCLGLSSIMKSSEQASLLSIYFVGFQLPLSGIILALPQPLDAMAKPFISAYWSWSGYIQTMRDTRFYDVVAEVSQTSLAPVILCLWVLGSHILLGLVMAYLGCKRSRWD